MNSLVKVFSGLSDSMLDAAARERDYDGVERILRDCTFQGEVDSQHITRKGINSALWKAAARGDNLISSLLLEYGAEIQTERDGTLGFAAYIGDLKEMQRMLKLGANPRTQSDYALRMAIENNNHEAAKILCAHGANIWEVLKFPAVTDKLKFGGVEYAQTRNFVGEQLKAPSSFIAPLIPDFIQP